MKVSSPDNDGFNEKVTRYNEVTWDGKTLTQRLTAETFVDGLLVKSEELPPKKIVA